MTARTTRIRTDDDCDLHVEQEGAGVPLVLISGLGGTGSFWDQVRPLLRETFSVVTFDHRGTGNSGRISKGHSIARLASDTVAILNALGIDRAHIAGHSTGGAIAQTLAIDWPQRISRLVISGSWARADFRFRLFFETRLAILESADAPVHAALSQLLGYPPDWINEHESSVRSAIVEARSSLAPTSVTAARIRMLLDHDRLGDLHRIKAPTLVLGAADDINVPISHSRTLAEGIPGATFIQMEGGHFFPRTAPQTFAKAVTNFLLTAGAATGQSIAEVQK